MGVLPKCLSYLHIPGDKPFERKAPLRLRDTDIAQHNGEVGGLDSSQAPQDITGPSRDSDSTGFPQFSLLPTEIRLQIWNVFLMMQTYEPRVINISVGTHYSVDRSPRHSVLRLLNLKSLRQADGFRSLLQTNWEAREATIEHLETHPPNHDYPYSRPARKQRWMGVRRLNRSLHRAGFDPARDVLFLHWLDNAGCEALQSDARNAATDAELLLPKRLQAGELVDTYQGWNRDAHWMSPAEVDFINLFRTVMMPVRGLVKQGTEFEDLFPDPMSGIPPVHRYHRMEDRGFIALVGFSGPAGRNLQMKDIEFIPDETVERIRQETGEGTLVPGTNRRVVESVLQRDVLVMTAAWRKWKSRVRYWRGDDPEDFHRRRLRFARVKEDVVAQLGRDRMAAREN